MARYDSETQEKILTRMLARVPAKFDKREGSIIYDANAPASVELQNFYIALDDVLSEVFADTASREYLIKRAAERGVVPKAASYATVTGSFTPVAVEIPVGARFSHGDYNYIVTEKIKNGLYYLQCETIGAEVNGVTGQLIPIDYIDGLQTAEITEVSILGEDEEDTEAFRTRYFASLASESFGGNKADYIYKTKSISGVGACKVYSGADWNGGGTVRIVIVDSDIKVPTETLVNEVQETLDPVANGGEGAGLAPIGHFVTVMGAYDTPVDIDMTITYDDGYNWNNTQDQIKAAIDNYFAYLNETWADSNNITVIIARLNAHVLGVKGILDIRTTTLNGKEENLKVDKDSIVSRGKVNGY